MGSGGPRRLGLERGRAGSSSYRGLAGPLGGGSGTWDPG